MRRTQPITEDLILYSDAADSGAAGIVLDRNDLVDPVPERESLRRWSLAGASALLLAVGELIL